MTPTIYISLYCKTEFDGSEHKLSFIRAYKFQAPPKGKTARGSAFVYSHKSERYHETFFYVMDWQGNQTELLLPHGSLRSALQRIGLDIR